jgi:Tol biopolymer transport system component
MLKSLPSEKTTLRDPVTGRTIYCFTERGCNCSPYFNSYAWTPDSEWFFFVRDDGDGEWLMACEYSTGALRKLAGPYPLEPQDDRILWPTLNAIPGMRAATFVQGGALWRVDLEGNGRAEQVARLPGRSGGDTDVSSDGRWHVMPIFHAPEEAWKEFKTAGWPVDPVIARHGFTSEMIRVDLNNGKIETLWNESNAMVDHISINPKDPDLILFCHEGAKPYQYGRMFLRRVGEATSRPLRDQRSGRVWVTHERWFPDGERISYHGEYRGLPLFGNEASHQQHHFYYGVLDVARDLPREYFLSDPSRQPWHCPPSPDGRRIVTDCRGGQGGLDLLQTDDATGVCRIESLVSLRSDQVPLKGPEQWRERDPVWSPDGRKILFRTARQGAVQIFAVELDG